MEAGPAGLLKKYFMTYLHIGDAEAYNLKFTR